MFYVICNGYCIIHDVYCVLTASTSIQPLPINILHQAFKCQDIVFGVWTSSNFSKLVHEKSETHSRIHSFTHSFTHPFIHSINAMKHCYSQWISRATMHVRCCHLLYLEWCIWSEWTCTYKSAHVPRYIVHMYLDVYTGECTSWLMHLTCRIYLLLSNIREWKWHLFKMFLFLCNQKRTFFS